MTRTMPTRCLFVATLVLLGVVAQAGRVHATPIVPPGLGPGDTYHLMFVNNFDTAITPSPAFPPFLPFFGSLEAADWTVTFAAADGGLIENWNQTDIIYKAVLSIIGESAKDRLDIQAPIYNTHGELIATGKADLWDGAIANAVRYDQHGIAVADETKVWTGTTELGNTTNSCGDWNNQSAVGLLGIATDSSIRWISTTSQPCNQGARLYGLSPVITVVPEPSSVLLAAFGFVALAAWGWRRRGQ